MPGNNTISASHPVADNAPSQTTFPVYKSMDDSTKVTKAEERLTVSQASRAESTTEAGDTVAVND